MDESNAKDYLIELLDNNIIDPRDTASNLVYWLSDKDALEYIKVNNLMPEESDEDDEVDYGIEVYRMSDWSRDGVLKLSVGDFIEPDIYYELLNSVPPIRDGVYFQPGEAYSSDEYGQPLYQTFFRQYYTDSGEPLYQYLGLRTKTGYRN